MRRAYGLLALVPLGAVGCVSLGAPTARLAEASVVAQAVLARELDAPAELCRQEARFDLLQRRFDPAGRLKPLRDHYLAPDDGVAPPGKNRCQAVRESATILRQGSAAVVAYDHALATLAGVASYDVPALAQASAEAGMTAQKLGAGGLAAGIIGGLGDPLRQLADLLLQALNRRASERAIVDGGPHLERVFDAFRDWIRLTRKQLDTLRTTVAGVMTALEARLGDAAQPLGAADLAAYLTLHDFAARWYDGLELAAQRQEAYLRLIEKWRQAHRELRLAVTAPRQERGAAAARVTTACAAVLAERATIDYIGWRRGAE